MFNTYHLTETQVFFLFQLLHLHCTQESMENFKNFKRVIYFYFWSYVRRTWAPIFSTTPNFSNERHSFHSHGIKIEVLYFKWIGKYHFYKIKHESLEYIITYLILKLLFYIKKDKKNEQQFSNYICTSIYKTIYVYQ